jgi:DmsE family decaheme c-type cytochrome
MMARPSKILGVWTLICLSFVLWAAAVTGPQLKAWASTQGAVMTAQKPAPPGKIAASPWPAAQAGATNIGDKECLSCHDQAAKGYDGSPHHRAADPRTPAAKLGCETCHGPASKHMDDPVLNPILNPKTAQPDQVAAVCTTCHTRGTHALWDGSPHESRGVSCVSCHSVHTPKSEKFSLREGTEGAVCAACHRDKASKVDRSGHMPVREGKMQCSSCHNVHGTTNEKLLRKGDSVAELCTSCHADKRGPYLWEHAPSRDGCVTCHDPHGSSNERMLVAKPPLLCQRCHVGTRHPSTIYDAALVGAGSAPNVRVYARSCVTCHANIHGSNHASGQFFVR